MNDIDNRESLHHNTRWKLFRKKCDSRAAGQVSEQEPGGAR
jgi:hypothetical protein